MRPALVATDLDGTFLGADGRPSEENARAALRCHELGIPFVVATGRPARWLDCLDPIREAEPFVLTSNGAVVFDLARGQVVESFPIEADVALEATRLIREAVASAHVCV
ncbi:MAG TPA: HAD family hydrolase, partial [Candidatus Luteococcus avicola]|nr:HAD family hydrolase [Candidatus Luteococcus avicola]